jgi:thiamine-phosphate pyrophosphorylase
MTTSLEWLWRTARGLKRSPGKPLGLHRRGAKTLPPLLFFTDPQRTPRPELVLARLPRGSGIVYRAFGAPDAVVAGRSLARLARRRGVVFIVGADAALAIALHADGVHWPERQAFRPGRNRRLGRRFLLTGAAHSLSAIMRARRAGLDALVVSPVFPSASPSAGHPLGAMRFTGLVRAATIPVYGLGGINAVSARRLSVSGAIGLAAVEAFAE